MLQQPPRSEQRWELGRQRCWGEGWLSTCRYGARSLGCWGKASLRVILTFESWTCSLLPPQYTTFWKILNSSHPEVTACPKDHHRRKLMNLLIDQSPNQAFECTTFGTLTSWRFILSSPLMPGSKAHKLWLCQDTFPNKLQCHLMYWWRGWYVATAFLPCLIQVSTIFFRRYKVTRCCWVAAAVHSGSNLQVYVSWEVQQGPKILQYYII